MKTSSVPNRIYNELKAGIQEITNNKEHYVQKPGVDFTRERKMSMSATMLFTITMGKNSLNKELFEFSEVENIDVTSSAFIQQRKKIKVEAYRDLFVRRNHNHNRRKTFRGYRMLAADGTAISMARNPDSETYIHPSNHPDGYNQYHLNALYDLKTRMYFDAELQPASKADERAALINMLRRNNFKEKTIITVDRGYESYNVFANFIETDGVDFVCRVKDGGAGALAEIEKLPMVELDRDITVEITTTQTNEDKRCNRRYIPTGSKKGKTLSPKTRVRRWDFQSPYTLNIRVVRFLLDTGNYETLITSLPKSRFTSRDLKEIYHMRWGIETSFRELKYFAGLINLHGKSDLFVAQEIYSALILYNLCEQIIGTVIVNNTNKKIHVYQVNYAMAFYLCQMFFKKKLTDGSKLLDDIGKYVEPIRPGRRDKRRMKKKSFHGFIYRVAA